MVVPVDAPNHDPAEIEHPIVLPVLLLEDVHDFGNAKSENPPPPQPKIEISLGDAKVEDDPPPIPIVCIDQRELFTTKHKFATRNDLLEWVREKARKLDFSTVNGKSDNGGNGRSAFVTLICGRGGSYTEYKRKSRREIAGSVKCECPFRLRGYLLTGSDWSLKVGDGRHNHGMTDVLKGHKTFGHLNPNERVHLQEMVDSNIPPRQMLTNLRKRNRTTSTTIKRVYNATHRYRRSIGGTRNDMQHLLKSLVYNGYVYHCRKYCVSDDVSDVFWAHPNSIKLFNTFSAMLMLDSTYKTNRYPLPLLESVGNMSTMKTFSIAFPYMMSERQDNVNWALERCREMFHSKDLYPKVVVRFWVDKNLHTGNTTTNRAESAHARLKKYMSSSMGDFSTN